MRIGKILSIKLISNVGHEKNEIYVDQVVPLPWFIIRVNPNNLIQVTPSPCEVSQPLLSSNILPPVRGFLSFRYSDDRILAILLDPSLPRPIRFNWNLHCFDGVGWGWGFCLLDFRSIDSFSRESFCEFSFTLTLDFLHFQCLRILEFLFRPIFGFFNFYSIKGFISFSSIYGSFSIFRFF